MASPAADPNIFPLRAGGGRAPLFLVAAPGVNALGYTAIARHLPASLPVHVVQPKGRGHTFPAEGVGPGGRDEYPIVAAGYVASIRTVQPDGPYQLAGMCDGGLLAFEMARLLEAAGQRVAVLAVLDTWPLENTTISPLLMLNIGLRGWRSRSPAERLALLRRKAAALVDRGAALVRSRAPSPAAEREALWRARLWPGRGFQPPVIQAPIAVLRVQEQPYWRIRDDALGWRGRTRGVVTVHILPGDHLTWIRAPHVETFARTLGAYLDASPSRA